MSIITEEYRAVQVEELLNSEMPEKFVEIIEGELIVMSPGGKYHNRIAFRFQCLFAEFCKSRPALDFGGDNEGFLIHRNPDTLLSPDACLYRYRPEKEKIWLEFSPEIAVEVLSPSNSPAEIAYKRCKYLDADSEQVWIVDPKSKSIQLYFSEGRRVIAKGDETINGEGIASGLKFNLQTMFQER